MADDPASATVVAAASRSSSSAADDDEEGTDSDNSNSDPAAPQDPPPPLPDNSPPPPPLAAAAPEPAGPIPPPELQGPGPGAGAEDSRRLFQRLWTDEEELLILRGFLEFTSRRGTAFASHQYDTGPFYEEIRRKLSFDFSKNQLIEKLRRLKKKYRVCAGRMAAQGGAFAFRSSHEGAIYDVARHIWRPAFKRDDGAGGDASDEDDINPAEAAAASAAAATALPGAVEDGGGSASAPTPRGRGGRRGRRRTAQEMEAPALPATPALMITDIAQEPAVAAMENSEPVIAPPPPVPAPVSAPVTANGPTEEDVRSILSPLLKELISPVAVAGQTGLGLLGSGMGFRGVGGTDILALGFGVAGLNPGVPSDEKWRQQQILELEVYLKRIELVREQVSSVLEELRSSGS